MSMSEATAPRPYTWLPILVVLMTVATLAIGAFMLHYIQTRMVATAGETLALTAAEVSNKLDRVLYERYGDVRCLHGPSAGSRTIVRFSPHISPG